MGGEKAARLRSRGSKRRISTDILKIIGLLLTVDGTVGAALLQNSFLSAEGNLSQFEQLLRIFQTGQQSAGMAAWAVVSNCLASIAWPIFAYLAVEGLRNTSSFPRYALRLLVTAVVSEVPYDLVMSGKWVDWSSQNFLFSLLIGLVMLYVAQEVGESREKSGALRVALLVGAVLWTFLIQSQLGILVVLSMAVMYYLSEHRGWRDLLVALLGLATVPASLGVLLIHFHKEGPCFGVRLPARAVLGSGSGASAPAQRPVPGLRGRGRKTYAVQRRDEDVS